MHDFKRGHKTLSQVEQQFQGWHQRHMRTSSHREKELLQLKNQYEKAQKQTIFGLPNIISLISRKPKKKSKVSSPDDSPVKQRNRKSETDSRRLSKISFTSTSSGVSDSSDVSRNIGYFNPDYGNYKEDVLSKNSSTSSNLSPKKVPPPVPTRYSLSPLACQLPDVVQENISMKHEDNVDVTRADCSSSNIPKIKLCLPPMNPDDPGIKEPGSPDYVKPNQVRFVFPPHTPKKFSIESTKDGRPNSPGPTFGTFRAIPKKNELNMSANGQALDPKKKSSQSSSKVSCGAKTAIQKRNIFKIPKSSKKEESMFYITSRKWSSFPDLKNAQLVPQPIYIELVDEQDYRSKSISDN